MLLSLSLLALDAHAFVFLGNPDVGFRVDRPQGDYVDGSVILEKLRIHHCGGGYTDYTVDKVVDPVEGYDVTISGGDHCYATWFWDSDMEIDGDGVAGPYTVEYTGSTATVTLSNDIDWVALSPWSVVSGTMVGGGPKLLTWVE